MRKTVLFAVISVLAVSVFSVTISAQSQYDIPAWVKGVAGFWAEDKITDSEFGEGLSFLIDSEIIKVPLIQELQNEINQLKAENSELRSQLNLPEPSTPEPPLHGDPEPSTPEPQISITVSTDQDSYVNGDVISVKGLVRNYSSGAVTLVVSNPQGDTVALDQLVPRTSGLFTTTFPIGPTFDSSGTYKITVNHKGHIVTTTFEFSKPSNVSFTDPRIVGPFGELLTDIEATQQIQISADIINHNNFEQPFTYYFTIRETGHEAWITGSLSSGQSFTPALSWIPTEAGTYTIDISLFDNIENKNKLTESLTIQITVEIPSEIIIYAQTEFHTYGNGGIVKISGTIDPFIENQGVTIIVISPDGETVGMSQTTLKSDGTFSDSFVAGGPLWVNSGEYKIQIGYHGTDETIEISYVK